MKKAGPAVAIISLGCPRNIVDSEQIIGRLGLKGCRIVDLDQAEVAIVNTCAFVADAKKESIGVILDLVALKKEGRLKKVIVYGCLAQRYPEELRREIPELDALIGRSGISGQAISSAITPAHYAYLKICEGCIHRCSYCVIPRIKGKFSSLGREEVFARSRELDRRGASEINIIGQDISGYGLDLYGKRELPRLVRGVLKSAPHVGWIRLLYLYPDKVIDELLALMKGEPRLCRYIDMPVQHINPRILKAMRRGTSAGQVRGLIAKIRKELPGAAIRTSLIVGFPSETEAEFKELLDFVRETEFDRLGAFIYSREEGSPAYKFTGQLPQKVKEARFNAVMEVQQEVSRRKNAVLMGKEISLLIEEKDKGVYLGRSQYDAPEVDGMVYVRSTRPLLPGIFIRAKIVDTMEYDLVGEALP